MMATRRRSLSDDDIYHGLLVGQHTIDLERLSYIRIFLRGSMSRVYYDTKSSSMRGAEETPFASGTGQYNSVMQTSRAPIQRVH